MYFLWCLAFISGVATVFSDDCRPGTCKPDQTCCPTNIPTIFGCCEYEHAVCCADRTHCCPKDTVCDLEKGACFPKMKEFNKLEKRRGTLDEEKPSGRRVMCDETTYCPYGSTCCASVDGSYDCCPYPLASCCPDQRHCCSHGTECDSSSQYCIEDDDGHATLSELKEPAMDIDLADLA
ncbi:Granulins [Araneus ventricosus]|uniref:Granulins n=1 Tax=Araneus ventricosus TaxID=182803 RepID=A0A4Y2CVY1_ARAVE|nr:Granulins [Araneus ventricosus]